MYKLFRIVKGKKDIVDSSAEYLHREGRLLLAESLKKYYGIAFSEDMLTFGEKGKPYISGAYFNISHSDGAIALALSDKENGCDCERIRPPSDGVMRRCFSPDEEEYVRRGDNMPLRFTMIWTLKEAYSKLVGQGISALRDAVFDIEHNTALFDSDCDFYQYIINDTYAVVFCEKGGCGKIFCEFTNFAIDKTDIIL